jgi:hypothetical protein
MTYMTLINNSQQVSDWLAPGPLAVSTIDLWLDDALPYANQLRGTSTVVEAATPIGLWVRSEHNQQQRYLIPWARVTAATMVMSG